MFAEMLLFFSFIVGITAAISIYGVFLARREDREARLTRNPELDPENYKKTA